LNLGGMVDLVFILWKVCDAGVLAFVDAKNVFHNRNGIVEKLNQKKNRRNALASLRFRMF
jgi:hypothetical protein